MSVFSQFDRCNLAQQVQVGFERRCAFDAALTTGGRTRISLEEGPSGTATLQTLRIGNDWLVTAKGPTDRFLQLFAFRPSADSSEQLAYVVTRSGLQEAVVVAMSDGRMREVLHVRGLRGGGRIDPGEGGVAVAENFCPPGVSVGCPTAINARSFAWTTEGYAFRALELKPTPTPRPP